ncbi:hypothetical protein PAMP_018964 [Pampus punctatissimus]
MISSYCIRAESAQCNAFWADADEYASQSMNKHKPWIETSYHGVITENTDIVLLDPPLVALDKDAPIPYADNFHLSDFIQLRCIHELE